MDDYMSSPEKSITLFNNRVSASILKIESVCHGGDNRINIFDYLTASFQKTKRHAINQLNIDVFYTKTAAITSFKRMSNMASWS